MKVTQVNEGKYTTTQMVSIICITYNQKQFIRECIDGFLIQKTNFKYEIVIHDDASTDGTVEIISEYEKKYPDLIKVIYQKENQFSKGVNMWVSVPPYASGKYLAMCEGDDYWTDPFMLQKEVDFLESNPDYGLVCGIANVFNQEKNAFVGKHGVIESEKYETIIQWGNDVVTSTSLMRNELLGKCIIECQGIIKKNLFFDTAMWYWFAYNSKIKFLNEIFSVYRVLPESLSNTKRPDKRLHLDMDFIYLKLCFILQFPIKDHSYWDKISESLYNENLGIVNFARYAGKLEVMNSLSYKLGNAILYPIKFLFGLFKKA